MEYTTVYNAAYSIFDGWWLPAITTIISVILWKLSQVFFDILPMFLINYLRGVVYFLVFLTLLGGVGFVYTNMKTALASARNTCILEEGKVEDFVAFLSGDQFKVNDTKFKYSSNSITGGFNHPSKKGGPIAEGLQVRLCYIGDRFLGGKSVLIVRVEIASKNDLE